MTLGPVISVVVPFFDSEQHLARCIEALLEQEGVEGGFEVILIDNGSSDGSRRIAEGFREVSLLEESKPGAYAARNRGLQRVQGEIIAFTDADCAVDPGWLRSIQVGMEDPAVAALLGHCRYPRAASRFLHLLGAYENAKAEYVLSRCPPVQHFAYANNLAVRASVFWEIGPFKEWRRAADSELIHRLAARRPDLRVRFEPSMRVTHWEFLSARQRARRLSLYTRTNSKIDGFQELRRGQRLRILLRLLGLR